MNISVDINTFYLHTKHCNKQYIGVKMELRKENKAYTYYGHDYVFRLANEKYHDYTSLIIKPSHIRLVKNLSDLSTEDLKAKIIEDWFAEENEMVRERNNQKAKVRRALKKESNNAK